MKEKINDLINKSGIVILCLIIVLLNVYVGTNLQSPIYIIQTLSITFGVIFVISKLLLKENNIFIKGKIDIFVLLLVVSTAIPLIFKTYVSYSSTINFILKYLTMYSVYIITRNIKIEEKELKIIINTFIVSSLFQIIIALDYQYWRKLTFVYNFINMVRVTDARGRLIGAFGYPNTLAAYLSFNMINAIFIFKKEKSKKIKLLYLIYIFIAMFCICLTVSKTVIGLFIGISIIALIIKYKHNILTKKVLIPSVCAVILIFIVLTILLQFSKPLYIKQNKSGYVDENFYNLNTEEKYTFSVDIQAKSDNNNSFSIEVVEINKYEAETILNKISFGTFDGEKTIEFIPSRNMQQIKLKFYNNTNEEFTIKSMKINGKKYTLKYKFIPDKAVFFFRTYSSKNKSVRQRAYFYYDSFKILKENWLLGAGGNAWRYNYRGIQEYNYISKEAHSYPLDVWMSFGILGIISLLAIYIITFKNIITIIRKKDKKLTGLFISIIMGLVLILVHCIIDFDMSFLIMLVLTFMIIAIVNKDDNKIKCDLKGIDACIMTILIFAMLSSINELYIYKIKKGKPGAFIDIATSYRSKAKLSDINYMINEQNKTINELEELLDYIEEYIALEPNFTEYNMYSNYSKTITELIDNNYIDYNRIEYIISLWNKRGCASKFDFIQITKRAKCMKQLISALQSYYEKNPDPKIEQYYTQIIEIFIKEYNEAMKNIKDLERNNILKTTADKYESEYTQIYDSVILMNK